MIEIYTYPPTKEDLKKVVTDSHLYFKINYKPEYSELSIVKQILEYIDDIVFVKGKYVENRRGDGYSIEKISNTAKMAIMLNVFPEADVYYRQEYMGEQAYHFLDTVPKDKKVKLMCCIMMPTSIRVEEIFPMNTLVSSKTGKVFNNKNEFDYEVLGSYKYYEPYYGTLMENFYDENGNKKPTEELKELLIEEGVIDDED